MVEERMGISPSNSFNELIQKVGAVHLLIALLLIILYVSVNSIIVPNLNLDPTKKILLFFGYIFEGTLELAIVLGTGEVCYPNENQLTERRPLIIEVGSNTDADVYTRVRNKIYALLVVTALEALVAPILSPLIPYVFLRLDPPMDGVFDILSSATSIAVLAILEGLVCHYIDKYMKKEKTSW